MAALGIKKVAWQGLGQRDKTILRRLFALLDLGMPAEYGQPNGTRWYVFDDWRFDLKAAAYLGCIIACLDEIPLGYEPPPTKVELRADATAFAESKGVVWPVDVEGSANPWQTALDAQGAPNAIQMAGSVPDNWTPIGGGD